MWRWREQYGGTIIEQYKRLGASCDYEEERFTLDEAYVRAVLKVFVALYEKGLIYRDNYMVNWDPGSRSAISDLEVEDREVTDTLYYVDYPLASGHGSITVATVRPETMLGDTAIAVHPDDDRYTRLVGETAILPIVGRRLKIIADDYVKPEFGTGALKITPGHDPNDFEIGRKHGLDELTVIGEDGRMTEAAGQVRRDDRAGGARGRRRRAARRGPDQPHRALHAPGAVLASAPGERIEPLISLQWFMKMDELAEPAIAAVEDGPRPHPPRGAAPALPGLAARTSARGASRASSGGATRSPSGTAADETYVGMDPPNGPGWERDPDVLDTWFSSALWPFATLGWPDQTDELKAFYPTDVLLDGARHPVPVGRPDGLHGARVRRRHPVRRRLRALGRPGAGRAPHVEVAGHGHRPADADRRRPAPAGVHRGRRVPRLRRRRGPLRPAGDVLARRTCASTRARSPRAASSPTSCSTPRGSCCCACPRASTVPAQAPAPADGRGHLDPLAPAGGRGRRRRGDRGLRVPPRHPRAVRASSTASCATGTSRCSSRGCTPRTTPRRRSSRCTCWPRRWRWRTR